jgi:dipeptide/tripeptide permease
MPIMNTSELKDARTNRFAPAYGGGIGFAFYQLIMGGAAAVIVAAVLWVLGFGFFGIGLAIPAGIFVALWPNYMNTRHKDPKKYIRDEVKRRTQHSLVINDQRVRERHDVYDDIVVEISDFPNSDPTLIHER